MNKFSRRETNLEIYNDSFMSFTLLNLGSYLKWNEVIYFSLRGGHNVKFYFLEKLWNNIYVSRANHLVKTVFLKPD